MNGKKAPRLKKGSRERLELRIAHFKELLSNP